MPQTTLATFIARWSKAEAAERANYQLFLSELCDVLGVPRPDPATDDTKNNAYVFERAVTFHHRGTTKTSTGRIDLYKRGCFVLEAKQYATPKAEEPTLALELDQEPTKSGKVARGTAAWDRAMLEALGQAENYARNLPAEEDPPPFLLVVDVGHVIEVYADFTQKGKAYLPFPDARSHRVKLTDLANDHLRSRLRQIWTDPLGLDPAKKAAEVTREVAGYLAELAKSFEKQRHEPRVVAEFLSRCLFCMFAEDVGLLPKESFHQLLESAKDTPDQFVEMLELLFEDMNQGRFSGLLKKKLLYFNGGLFASAKALPVNGTQLGLLRKASTLEWKNVEPAIFGTLLERALSPEERHKLGAHYTPRSYVERLVLPTVIEPLREEWQAVRAAAVTLASRGTKEDPKKASESLKKAQQEVRAFHGKLCSIRVLDPACGSGNFLYVALEQIKRLEGEIVTLLHDLGDRTDYFNFHGATVDPHQFLGIELNPRAAAIAELVLWIGYLQWHFRVHGDSMPAEPVLRKFNNIVCADAVLSYKSRGYAKDAHGKTRHVWDRRSFITDTSTGREIPDETRTVPLEEYVSPSDPVWPKAEFIVGNPPYLGARTIREAVGDGYLSAVRQAHPDVPENADYVMYWWNKAGKLLKSGEASRFGFITTNSISQSFNRAVVEPILNSEPKLSLCFAIPDHPWVDASDGAAIRIAMTVVTREPQYGLLRRVVREGEITLDGADVSFEEATGRISPKLAIGTDALTLHELRANRGLCCVGYQLTGTGFAVSQDELKSLRAKDGPLVDKHLRPLLSARDITKKSRGLFAIDAFGMSASEFRHLLPQTYQVVYDRVKPERDQNARGSVRDRWWIFGEPRSTFRPAVKGLSRVIVAPLTSKFRLFVFSEQGTVADSTTVMFAFDDPYILGVLSSKIHVTFSLLAGGRLGVGNDPRYNKSVCFDPFPFPVCSERKTARIRELAEELDAFRKQAQARHKVGLTEMYNVLEKLECNTPLSKKDVLINDAARISTLLSIHEELDKAVAEAYGWNWPLSETTILDSLWELNKSRYKDELEGNIRWLRPDYQKAEATTEQAQLMMVDRAAKPGVQNNKVERISKPAWPKSLAERARLVESMLNERENPASAEDLAKVLKRARVDEVGEILETLAVLGRLRRSDVPGTFVK